MLLLQDHSTSTYTMDTSANTTEGPEFVSNPEMNISMDTAAGGGLEFVKSPEEYMALLFEAAIFFIIGFTGNTILLVTLVTRIRNRTKKVHSFNYTLVALAVGDLLMLTVYVPLYIAVFTPAIFDSTACQVVEYVRSFLVLYVHGIVYCVIPFERYIAVCRPLVQFGKSQVMQLVILVILVSAILAIPNGILSTPYDADDALVGCHYQGYTYYGGVVFNHLSVAWSYSIFLFALVSYVLVFYEIVKSRTMAYRVKVGQTNAPVSSVKTSNARLAGMLFGVMLLDYVSWFPYFLIVFGGLRSDHRYAFLAYLSNTLNFALFGIVNSNIRKDMKAILRCKSETEESTKTSSSRLQASSSDDLKMSNISTINIADL